MKIKALVAICKRKKRILLCGNEELQYLGDGSALYPLHNMPLLTQDNIFTAFDITEKQRNKIMFEQAEAPKNIVINDTNISETPVEIGKIGIYISGQTFLPIKASQGLLFVDAQYLAPLSDLGEYLNFFERITDEGRSYIVAKEGFVLMGIIMPYNLVNKAFTEELKALVKQCELALFNSEQKGESLCKD